jgi:hypothetical protein
MLYTSLLWWIVTWSWEVWWWYIVAMIMIMMLLCPYFVFINTSLSRHVVMIIDIGFRLRTRSKLGGVDMSILHHVFLLLFIIFLDHYNTVWCNSNAFSLLICKIHRKTEIADSWNSGPEKAISEIHILHNSKWAEISWKIILEYIKNIGLKKYMRVPISCPQGTWAQPPPGRA